MEGLNNDWLTKGLIDFEYKKYILLAYLKSIRQNFRSNRLYPYLSDIIFHYNNLQSIRDNKKLLQNQFPKTVNKIDLKKLEISYKKMVKDDALMKELEKLVSYSLNQLSDLLLEGKEVYDFVEDNICFQPIGLSALYLNEGYILLSSKMQSEVKVYRYHVTFFESSKEKYRGVKTEYIESFTKTFSNTYEKIKLELIKQYKELANPATYAAESTIYFPIDETLLPVVKRLLIKSVNLS